MIDTKTVDLPLEIRDAKPSEIVRNNPYWVKGYIRRDGPNGEIENMCSYGILFEQGGGDWSVMFADSARVYRIPILSLPGFSSAGFGIPSSSYQKEYQKVCDNWGITQGQMQRVIYLNDHEGQDAAANYLESIGR